MIIQYYLDVLNISSIAKVNTSSWVMLFVLNTFFIVLLFLLIKVAKDGPS